MSDTVQMPGYRIVEYRLALPLGDALAERLQHLRQGLHEKYKVPFSDWWSASLPIVTFHAFEKSEARLLEQLRHIAGCHRPFMLEVKNFAAYPSHTIYANVVIKMGISELVKSIKRLKWLMDIPEQPPHFIQEPQLVIAQLLKPMQFINMWLECEHTIFTGKCEVSDMALYKRVGKQQPYEEVSRIAFNYQPVVIQQGVLFS